MKKEDMPSEILGKCFEVAKTAADLESKYKEGRQSHRKWAFVVSKKGLLLSMKRVSARNTLQVAVPALKRMSLRSLAFQVGTAKNVSLS